MNFLSKEESELIRNRFKELMEDRDSLSQEIGSTVRSINSGFLKRPLEEAIEDDLMRTKALHWRSFLNGWLECKFQMLENDTEQRTE